MSYSERWLAYKIDTKQNRGADPHRAAEYWRKNGIPKEQEWPSDEAASFDDFYVQPPPKLDDTAKTFLTKYDLKHDTVRSGGKFPSIQEAMWDALQYSPLGCSVHLNAQDANGYYYKQGFASDSHWTVIVAGEYGKYFLACDSAEPVYKKLAWDQLNPMLVKRYAIFKRLTPEEQGKLSWMALALQAVLAWIGLERLIQAQNRNISPVAPSNPPKPTEASKAEKLYQAAKAAQGTDPSKHGLAPQDRACAESLSRVVQKVYPDFPTFLSTAKLYAYLSSSPHFLSTDIPIPGTVSVFPTMNGVTGHCGIWGKLGWVMSNDSKDGYWKANYETDKWEAAAKKRGLPVYYFIPQ